MRRQSLTLAADAVSRFQHLVDELVSVLCNLAVVAAIDVQGYGRRYFTAGHVDLTRTEVARPEHLFQIGSQSKTIVAMTLLLLHRAGLIDLDAKVREYLDLPIDERITVRHLAMNTCGLGENTFALLPARLDPRLKWSPRDLVALALPQGQLFEPGSRFDYCNTGWVVAAMVIESICGKPYGQVIQERICQPLGLANSFFGGGAPKDRMLRGYLGSGATGGLVDIADCHEWAFGAGDGVSGVDDMLDLFGSLCREDSAIGLALGDLNATTAKPSDSPVFPLSVGTEYGLGIERRAWAGCEVWGHPGSTSSYMSGTWIDPERRVTVTTCVTRAITLPAGADTEIRYPRAQLFSMALNTAYTLALLAADQRA